MSSTKAAARRAGWLYLLLAVVGPINALWMPNRFIVPGDAAATAARITAAQLTYRIGVLSGLVSHVVFLLLVLSLYHLLKNVDRRHARLMVVLVVVGIGVALVNLVHQMAPLVFLSGADFLSVFSTSQREALAMGFLRLRSAGASVEVAFWGLWLFPFGILVIRSGFLPRLLGVLLIVGGFAYVALSLAGMVLPAYRPVVSQVLLPFYAVGELSTIVWLLLKGAREEPLEARPSP